MKNIAGKAVGALLAAAAVIFLLLLPAGSRGRGYYLISIIIIALSILGFYLKYEKRRPMARDIVLIAVLIAVAVSGRVVFYMIPQFKAIIAVIIISGIALGAETGFMAGSLSAFVSNMFFGQGPWTPWQMLGMGIIGWLAGFLFGRLRVPARRGYVCAFGVISVFAIYGGIMDFASMFFIVPEFSWKALFGRLCT